MMNLERWQALMQPISLPSSEDCFKKLVEAYSEKHRHYHTTAHIEAMLKHFDDTVDLAEQPHEVELAIWFHDAIYKPLSSSNEQDSAEWAKSFLQSNKYAPARTQRVHDLIMATLHNGHVETNDQKLLIDIDLSILGARAEIYDEFERNVRKEYKLVPSMIFKKKRKELLQQFLEQPNIYHTNYFRDKYEATARLNLQRAITALS